jgi:uncharacterized protein DUF4384
MILPLVVALSLTPAAPRAVRADNPPVRVWIDPDRSVVQGDRVRVHVRTEQDAYVVVLRTDGAGRVRVLFPLDPGDDNFARGGDKFEVRGRGDREAFFVDERSGTGAVLAAASPTPFKFDELVRGDHWDYRVLASEQVRSDPEAGLLELVRRMAGDQHFDYDVVTYTVGDVAYRPYGYQSYGYRPYGYYGGFGFRLGLGFGRPYYYCDPFFDAFCDPFFAGYAYDPFYYGGFPYGPYCWWCGPRIVFVNRTFFTPFGPRPRTIGFFARRRTTALPAPTPPFVLPNMPLATPRPRAVAAKPPMERREPESLRPRPMPERRVEPRSAPPSRAGRGGGGGGSFSEARPRSEGRSGGWGGSRGGGGGGGGTSRSGGGGGGGGSRSSGGGGRRH